MKPGTQLGNYVVDGTIAGGGMGMVYRAHNARVGLPVALKVLLPNYAESAKIRHRFEQEAYVQAQLQHPIVPPFCCLGRSHVMLAVAIITIPGLS